MNGVGTILRPLRMTSVNEGIACRGSGPQQAMDWGRRCRSAGLLNNFVVTCEETPGSNYF